MTTAIPNTFATCQHLSQPPSLTIKTNIEFKNRVNHYLYGNLNRVLAEIYYYCEHESNANECNVALDILSKASVVFHQLHQQLILLSKANSMNTKSIAWNVSSLVSPSKNIYSLRPKTAPNMNCKNCNKNICTAKQMKNGFQLQFNETQDMNKIKDNNKTCDAQNMKLNENENNKISQKPKKVIKCWADYDTETELGAFTDDELSADDSTCNMGSMQNIEEQNNEQSVVNQFKDEAKDLEDEKSNAIANKNNVFETHDKNGKAQKWRKKKTLKSENNIIKDSNMTDDVWFTSIAQPVRSSPQKEQHFPSLPSTPASVKLADIMNDQKKNKKVKTFAKSTMAEIVAKCRYNLNHQKSSSNHLTFNRSFTNIGLVVHKPKVNEHHFPLPFNQIAKTHKICSPQKIQTLIHRLQNRQKNKKKIDPLLKQEKAEKRRMAIKIEKENRWKMAAAHKKFIRERLKKNNAKKLMEQKLKSDTKLYTANMRYHKKLFETQLKQKQYQRKIQKAKEFKKRQLKKSLLQQKLKQETKMKNAKKRYENNKLKIYQKLHLKNMKKERISNNNDKKQRKQNKKCHKKKQKKSKKKFIKQQNIPLIKYEYNLENIEQITDKLNISCSEFFKNMGAKKVWLQSGNGLEFNAHIANLRNCTQIVCNKINRFLPCTSNAISLPYWITGSTAHTSIQCKKSATQEINNALQNVLKAMNCPECYQECSSYILMYLLDTILVFFNEKENRTNRLILQIIVNATQKNRAVQHFIFRSNHCFKLLHILLPLLAKCGNMSEHESKRIEVILQILILCLDSIREFPNLMLRKKHLLQYLCFIKFFQNMQNIFCNKMSDYALFLKILSFIQILTVFNDGNCGENEIILETFSDTNIIGLLELVASFVEEEVFSGTKIIVSSFEIMNNVARIDLELFQAILEPKMKEILHILLYLLKYVECNVCRTNDFLLNQIILFMGYCTLNNKAFQECFNDQSLIHILCNLPFEYFINPIKKLVLFPTLICMTFNNEQSVRMLHSVLNVRHLLYFIIAYHSKEKSQEMNGKKVRCVFDFELRFPMEFWKSAAKFFASHMQKM